MKIEIDMKRNASVNFSEFMEKHDLILTIDHSMSPSYYVSIKDCTLKFDGGFPEDFTGVNLNIIVAVREMIEEIENKILVYTGLKREPRIEIYVPRLYISTNTIEKLNKL